MQQIQIPPLAEGETYVGSYGNAAGELTHVTLLVGDNDGATQEKQLEWAKSIGGDLPNRIEYAMLFAYHRDRFQKDAYWSNEECSWNSGLPGTRASTTAASTTTTRALRFAQSPSADRCQHADVTFAELVDAYFDCRRTKRNSASALAFEERLETNLRNLYDELIDGSYRPGRSICFVITRPKPREVWAAEFRDRIVHHLWHNRIMPRFHAQFIADSCACIPGRGTLYGVERLEQKVRSITQNWSKPAYYLKCDLANFFVAIDKRIVWNLLSAHITEPWWLRLTETILFHDPRLDYIFHGDERLLLLVPPHKRLILQPGHLGLPIGNLPSQDMANIYMNVVDQHAKHALRCRHYIRYVDDFILLHESAQWLNAAKASIENVLLHQLAAQLNPKKTILQPIDTGIDFVGQVIKPWRRTLRRKTFNDAIQRVRNISAPEIFDTANSYFGLMRQATRSHGDRAVLAQAVMQRGHTVNANFCKTYRKANK